MTMADLVLRLAILRKLNEDPNPEFTRRQRLLKASREGQKLVKAEKQQRREIYNAEMKRIAYARRRGGMTYREACLLRIEAARILDAQIVLKEQHAVVSGDDNGDSILNRILEGYEGEQRQVASWKLAEILARDTSMRVGDTIQVTVSDASIDSLRAEIAQLIQQAAER